MAVSCIDNSPIPFNTQANCQTCFNDDYCVLVEETDTTELQFKLTPVTGDNVIPEGDMTPQASGTTTSAAVGKLIDSGASFMTDGVLVGGVVYNSTDDTYHEITAIDSETQLSIATNIASGKDYVITNWDISLGSWGTGVEYDGSQMTFQTSAASVRLTNRLTTGKLYRLRVYSAFNDIGNGRLSITNGAGTVYFEFGILGGHVGTTVYFVASGSNIILTSTAPLGSSVFTVTDLEIVEMSSLSWELKDCTTGVQIYDGGTTVDSYNVGIKYQDNPNAPFWGTLRIYWADLSLTLPDCVCLCVHDYAEEQYGYLWNGTFDLVSGAIPLYWTIDNATNPGFDSSLNDLSHADGSGGGAGTDTASQTLMTALDSTLCYVLSFDYDSDSGFTLTVKYDTASGLTDETLEVVTKALGAGTHTIDIANLDISKLTFSTDNDQEFTLDNITLKMDSDCYYCSCQSSCISVAADHDSTNLYGCNTLFKGTCSTNAFGFNFEDFDIELTLRLFAKLRNSGYNEDTEYYTYSDGTKQLIYAEREKTLELQVYEIPEGVHDALNIITLCDTFTIDGVEYVRTGDYAPNWRKSSQKAPVIMTVAKKTQNRFNTFS